MKAIIIIFTISAYPSFKTGNCIEYFKYVENDVRTTRCQFSTLDCDGGLSGLSKMSCTVFNLNINPKNFLITESEIWIIAHKKNEKIYTYIQKNSIPSIECRRYQKELDCMPYMNDFRGCWMFSATI